MKESGRYSPNVTLNPFNSVLGAGEWVERCRVATCLLYIFFYFKDPPLLNIGAIGREAIGT